MYVLSYKDAFDPVFMADESGVVCITQSKAHAFRKMVDCLVEYVEDNRLLEKHGIEFDLCSYYASVSSPDDMTIGITYEIEECEFIDEWSE